MSETDRTISAFTRELIEELAEDHYRLRAWQHLLSRSWAQSIEDLRECPARTLSFWRWSGVVGSIGMGIMLITLGVHGSKVALVAAMFWLPWFVGTTLFVLGHLGMVDDGDGKPYPNFLLPNGLSLLRLGLASLVIWPVLSLPNHPVTGPVYAIFLVALAITDVLDGWLARKLGMGTRMGRMIDFLADMSFLSFLTIGLYSAGVLPVSLLVLVLIRYPAVFVLMFVFYFARGPISVGPTVIGKVTTLTTNVVLLAIALALLLEPSWLADSWMVWPMRIVYLLITINLLYLVHRAVNWPGTLRRASS